MTRGQRMGVRPGVAVTLAALALVVALTAGCLGGGTDTGSGDSGGSGSTTTTGGPGAGGGPKGDGPVMIVPDSIPDGRAISSDGNPEYTFRSLWKKALPAAFKWKPDAYLVSASGSFVNDDGVPSEWMMVFRTRGAGGKDFRVWIDPWGNVTRTEETAADTTLGTLAIPPTILDSDEAVAKAKPALAEKVSADKTKDPRLGLGFKDRMGPYWYYVVLETSNGRYLTALLDARTGDVKSVW